MKRLVVLLVACAALAVGLAGGAAAATGNSADLA